MTSAISSCSMNLSSLSFPVLLIVFIIAAVVIWIAGIKLSHSTDVLSKKFGLGEALGGLLLLAIVTNLPELAIVISASIHNNIELAVGNILGGIAIQTLVIVVLDAFGAGKKGPIISQSPSLVLILEGTMVIVALSLVIIGHEMPPTVLLWRVTPAPLLIFIFWLAGTGVISKVRKKLPDIAMIKKKNDKPKDTPEKNENNIKVIAIFIVCAVATLAAGFVLEITSNAIAIHIGMTGVIFGATILASVTALPEVSTGLAAAWMQDYEMAISDILGGNAFLPVLFLLASVCSPSGPKALHSAHSSDIYLTGLGMMLTSIYMGGLIIQPKKQFLRMGLDSVVVLVVYILGIMGLFFISQ
jgi:cation:H+ antiporter